MRLLLIHPELHRSAWNFANHGAVSALIDRLANRRDRSRGYSGDNLVNGGGGAGAVRVVGLLSRGAPLASLCAWRITSRHWTKRQYCSWDSNDKSRVCVPGSRPLESFRNPPEREVAFDSTVEIFTDCGK